MMAGGLEKAGRLQKLVTRWCFTERELRNFQKLGILRHWRRPNCPVNKSLSRRLPAADLYAAFAPLLGAKRIAAVDRSFTMVDRCAAALVNQDTLGVFGREDCCLES